MVVRRRKKSRSMRGIRTHGYGSIGQHRKSGSRGGKGAAGMHKHKWSWVVKYFPDWYGKRGFTYPVRMKEEYQAINVGELNELVRQLVSDGKIHREGEFFVLDLSSLGYSKLLGRGKVDFKLKVAVYRATKEA
ncbi:MAG: 50S ribosomal protein L15, partial [Sulfolobales archaeon]|nr:50S ribosomal protein L15 [Sulfolobales archaeon]